MWKTIHGHPAACRISTTEINLGPNFHCLPARVGVFEPGLCSRAAFVNTARVHQRVNSEMVSFLYYSFRHRAPFKNDRCAILSNLLPWVSRRHGGHALEDATHYEGGG